MILRRLTALLLATSLLFAAGSARAGSLADVIPNLFGPDGIVLAPPPAGFSHAAHFRVGSRAELTNLNDALRGQLSNFPIPSPASGFTFQLDPSVGVFTRSTESFGPIYANRAETIGRGKLALGFTYSHFTFDSLDGKDLHDGELSLPFFHEETGAMFFGLPPFFFERDNLTARIFADIESDLFVLTATYGVLSNLDLTLAVPIVRTSIDVKSVVQINRLGTGPAGFPGIHTFEGGGDTKTFRASDESAGLGDIVLGAKYNFLRTKHVDLAAALDLRLPSGDEDELRGIGSPRVRPSFIASTKIWRIAPHVNVGLDLGDTSDLDNEVFYNVGFDVAVFKPVTFAFDLVGRYVIDNSRPKAGSGPTVRRDFDPTQPSRRTSDDHILNAAIGFKANPWRNVLLLFNVLIPLNDTGLRDDITPLVGVEVTF
jgi:hypothetical protein